MFDWLRRGSSAWSLADLESPWGDAPAILDRISLNPQERLPEEEDESGIRWAPGALDGVLGHHGLKGDEPSDIKSIIDATRILFAKSSPSRLRRLAHAVGTAGLLEIVDELLAQLRSEFPDERVRLGVLGRFFATKAPRQEAVKFGIAVLGIAGDRGDIELLLRLGKCEEFTLFSAVAIQNVSGSPEHDVWRLARSVNGWGRIQTVERLAKTQDTEIRSWMLREGFRNSVMHEYLACICARAGRLHDALRASPRDVDLLDSATDLILALLRGGPAEDIDDYEYAAEAVEAYLDAMWVQNGRTPLRFVVVKEIQDWLSATGGWEGRSKCGWNETNRARCQQLCHDLLVQEAWRTPVLQGLAVPDPSQFSWANRAARMMGIDTWDHLFARVEAEPITSYSWYDLTEATDAARIDRLVDFAERVIPLAAIATGPALELGLGQGFEPHGALDWMLQLLERFPGKGWPLIRAGLQSPVERNRHWSLRVFKKWNREDWPADAVGILKEAATREPDQDMREDLVTYLEAGD